ncbi:MULTISPECIES: zinc dependent phospholipase C family protein [Tissierellales]|jgi:hypothetical protein|uniref:Phospholipase C/D domain-containing protein n=1 Tax=Acidilutibacter cellobiosedens TaxID=2507161 RepID=A0A410QD35_9FIRM|nr:MULTISPECIES: zinc dependent phospholipase C family protein [Tissierellales]QAT61901.1 hypothetical protein EQM13_09995 [Acidilutibacter cellobiosedens]SCL81275.1 hypothetical protein PP176A_0032 [Sporanaerobacter sp. PP17-6a]
MFFFTHLFISKELYQHFSGEMKIDRRAFAYGNIKPDLPLLKHDAHTLENCLFIVCDKFNRIMEEEETSSEEFSMELGEICHYVCDFFCYYHLSEEIYNKKIRHFLYELRLHFKLYIIRFTHGFTMSPSKMKPKRNIVFIVTEMRKAYFSQPDSMKKDLDYAFLSTIWICESIICYMKHSSNASEKTELALHSYY